MLSLFNDAESLSEDMAVQVDVWSISPVIDDREHSIPQGHFKKHRLDV